MAQIIDLGHSLPLDRPFTTAEAHDRGLGDRQLRRMVQHGWLRRPVHGVYVVGALEDTLELRCAVLRLVVPDDAFLCDHTAAWLHAGDRALAPNDHLGTPEMACFKRAGRLRRSTVRSGERAVRDSDLVEIGGLVTTTPLRTALDLGRLPRSNDARLHGMDTMLSLGVFEHGELLAGVNRFAGQRGVVALRALVMLADGGSESFGESALRLRWHQAGLPRPVTQLEVPRDGGAAYRLDMGLPEEKAGAEYDGQEFHSSPEQREHDQARRAWLRRAWTVEVFRRDNVFGGEQDAERRLRALHESITSNRRRHYL
ncbi:type IV toxin-antitoxin system AbiEi family antitoxin domain-containing protein [Nocardioides sp. OK12]|uniref:type IV toxin-antitoxin system AbiEi family antitoxin domain-containing protein n=1 Tax=Nocardioides sp. OK12 TaxID=2758661 RepID=UPI0021C2DBD6|nr:type IV toxin-antitoxin system AbiEi family antitoxin domain-containing protein [Nocardioides sp. OK12]